VRKAVNSGWFTDRVWLGQVDAVFARLYFNSMNAHINRDFFYVLAEVGLTAADGTSHKLDHNAYNPRLDALLDPVFAEEAERFDPTFDDFAIAGIDAIAAGTALMIRTVFASPSSAARDAWCATHHG
jgi:hypothetical protein